jgi:hypothetical protein
MNDDEFAEMDDPAFIAERRRLHDAISATEEDDANLREQYRRIEAEFLRRAGMGWQRAS